MSNPNPRDAARIKEGIRAIYLPSQQVVFPPELSREAQLAAVLTDALDHSAHVYGCGMLNSAVDPENWKACTCWYGRARKLIGRTS